MCGISGFIDFEGDLTETDLRSMTDAQSHRGPDDSGYYCTKVSENPIGLGHRRLSIIDLSPGGHQPMHYKSLSIVYNGEIYNYKEVRKELEAEGYHFDSSSDTAVVLRAFDKWGVEAVHRFIGMFSFAILDSISRKLWLFRDRAGVKPLYYYSSAGCFLFSSELKSFHHCKKFKKEISPDALAQFFLYGYILAPLSIFKKTWKVKPAHYLEFDISKRTYKENKYWDIVDSYLRPTLKISEEDAVEEVEQLLKSAFEYRMVSDVPVGVFLSGGYDSSTVAAILQHNRTEKLKTFTIGFKIPGFNEAHYAKQVADYLGTDHTEFYCTEAEAKDVIPTLPHFYDEPFGDSSAIPTILVSKIARQKVTVALSADGGDELFGGYNKHLSAINALNKLSLIPQVFHKALGNVLSFIPLQHLPFPIPMFRFNHFYLSVKDLLRKGVEPHQILKYGSHHLNQRKLKAVFNTTYELSHGNFDDFNGINGLSPLSKILATDYKTYLPDDILVKVDRATMSVSLEGREPFLDHRIAEFVSRLPEQFKLNGNEKKHLLKQINHKYLPKKIMDRPKMGFGIPVEHWFRDDLKNILLHYVNKERIEKQKLFDFPVLNRIVTKYLKGSNEEFEFIWSMIVFQLWYDKWMIN